MEKLIEQTKIAEMLGISRTALRRLVQDRLPIVLIENKRHYDFEAVCELIKDGK